MSFPRYPKYKPSGVEWLGDVPEGWVVKPVRQLAAVVNGFPFDSKLFDAAEGIPLIRIRDLNQSKTDTFYKGDLVERAAITSDDVLVGMDGDFNVGRWLGEGRALLNQRMCCIRGRTPLLTRLLEYSLPIPLKAINEVTYATTVKHLASSQIEKTFVALPPTVEEQTAIAEFLDRETGKVDELVAEQRRLMELLKEKRQAVISRAVTQGLNPHAPMRPSGIEWLGDVPEHWTIERGRFLFRKLEMPPETGDGVVTCFRDGQVTLRENRRTDGFTLAVLEVGYQRVRTGDLVIHGMDAFAGAIGVSESDGKCTPEYSVMTPTREGIDSHYYAVILRLMAQRNFVFVICPSVRERAPRFRFESFRDVYLPVPPFEEQQEIIRLIESVTVETLTLTAEAQRAIDLLQERRTALISAAVTGQIDVRNPSPKP